MSRKSRQRAAAGKLKHAAPPWAALFIAVAGLLLGTVFAIPSRVVTEDEAVPVTAVLREVQGEYRSRWRSVRQYLHTIRLSFEDHDPLYIGQAATDEALLEALSARPAGTVLDMLVQPEGTAVLALRAGDEEIIRFEDTVEALKRDNRASPFLSIPFFLMGAYGVWSLVMCWQYRRVLASHM